MNQSLAGQAARLSQHGTLSVQATPPASAVIPVRIEACETEEYHQAGEIQPHGVLLTLDPASLRVRHASANAPAVLGRELEALLGAELRGLLSADSLRRLRAAAEGERPGRFALVLEFAGTRARRRDAFAYRSGDVLCIEFEPDHSAAAPPRTAELPSSRFFELAERITHADVGSAELPDIVCAAIREVTGLDRVYFCQFDPLGHGHVLGESLRETGGALPSLRDHRFPATDIPQTVRQMSLLNPFRLIPDIEAPPVPILAWGAQGGVQHVGRATLDLTLSACRAVAPPHVQYLRNMGVRASLSFPVVQDGRLRALFGGHHAAAINLSFRALATCRHLAELFKSRAAFLREREERALLADRVDSLFALSARFETADGDLGLCMAAHHDAFCALMDADDVICRFHGRDYPGRSLPPAEASRLLGFVGEGLAREGECFQSDCLGQAHEFAALCPQAAGVFAVALDLSGGNIIAWLRREVVVVEKWSGDPHNPVEVDHLGGICPRTSFQAYRREVKGTCAPWSGVAADLARQLRHAFALVMSSHLEAGMRKAAEQSNALKSEFVANVSHELRSPMHAIIGFAELLVAADDRVGPDRRRRYAGAILDSGQRLLRLINDMLDLSKMEAGRMAFLPSSGDIVQTIRAVVTEVEGMARQKGVDIVIDDGRHDLRCEFDSLRMGQVMMNLLSNALRFSPSGGRIVITLATIQTAGPEPAAPHLVIEVADQGVGVPAAELEAVFEKFRQSSRTRGSAGGTGLGLSICREITDLHGGRIWARNNEGGGTSFVIEIPTVSPAKAAPVP